jgi:4-amino-4-deoxy-L-arabinose transferase-like glycosyltransferase
MTTNASLSRAARAEPLLSTVATWKYVDRVVLSLMVVSITCVNFFWLSLDSHRLYWDYARHLGDSLVYKNAFSLSHPLAFIDTYVRYPPFVYWVTDVFYAVFGTDLWVAILSNIVFLAILIFATYGLGKVLWNRQVGLLAALVVITTPMFVTQFREYMLDAPLSAMVALALYLLVKSDHFTDRRTSLLLGIACGLGLLTKWVFPFFLALPVVVAGGTAFARSRSERSTSRIFNITAAGFLTIAVSSVWYLPNLDRFRSDIGFSTNLPAEVQGSPPLSSLSSWLWYFWNLVNNNLYLVPFLFFVVGIVYVVRKDESAARNSPLILSVVGGYIALTLIGLKDPRYTMPLLPQVAVVATHWLQLRTSRVTQWLTRGLIAYSILAFFVISFGTSILPKSITVPLKARPYTSNLFFYAPPESIRSTGIVIFAQHGFVTGRPSDDDWHEDDLFRTIAAQSEHATFWYAGPPDEIWFQTWGLRYYSLRYHATWVALPQQARFLIIRGPVPARVTRGFALIAEYQLRYDGPARLYERV